MNQLAQILNYEFKDRSLLKRALSHRSAEGPSNERLEFIGDSILSFIIATELFARYPKLQEGELSQMRANLVRKETLAAMAKDFRLGEFLYLGIGEQKSGGSKRDSIVADAFEAIIGAIFVDGGIGICREKVLAWYDAGVSDWSLAGEKDPKSILQEYLQANKKSLPKYEIINTEGKSHQMYFKVRCTVEGMETTADGEGTSIQKAEQSAAQKFLQEVNYDRK